MVSGWLRAAIRSHAEAGGGERDNEQRDGCFGQDGAVQLAEVGAGESEEGERSTSFDDHRGVNLDADHHHQTSQNALVEAPQ